MGSGAATFVTADELVEAIGVDADALLLAAALARPDAGHRPRPGRAQERENPVYYVQYAHARPARSARKVEEDAEGVVAAAIAAAARVDALHPSERRLVKRIADFPWSLAEAAERRAAAQVVHYSHELASDVSKFYRDCRVTGDEVHEPSRAPARRLSMPHAACSPSRSPSSVSAPERM